MPPFLAHDFFSPDSLCDLELWREEEPVWNALRRLQDYLHGCTFSQQSAYISPLAYLSQPETITIGMGTIVEPGAFIQGPCVLGRGCIVRHGAHLRGGVICGERCVIGHGSEVKRSILMNEVQLAHFNYVGDSVIGSRVNFGAGVKCANLRLDRREVTIFSEGEIIHTGLKKFGSIVGDGCQIGCNAVLNPGTLVGAGSISHPLLNLQGVIPPRTRIRSRRGDDLDFASLEVGILESLRQ